MEIALILRPKDSYRLVIIRAFCFCLRLALQMGTNFWKIADDRNFFFWGPPLRASRLSPRNPSLARFRPLSPIWRGEYPIMPSTF